MGHVVVNRFGRQSLTVKGLMWLMWQHIHRKSHSARPYSASAAREEEVWLLENIKNLMTWKTKSFFWTLTGCITEGFTVKALINDHRDFKIRRGVQVWLLLWSHRRRKTVSTHWSDLRGISATTCCIKSLSACFTLCWCRFIWIWQRSESVASETEMFQVRPGQIGVRWCIFYYMFNYLLKFYFLTSSFPIRSSTRLHGILNSPVQFRISKPARRRGSSLFPAWIQFEVVSFFMLRLAGLQRGAGGFWQSSFLS